MVKLAKSTLPKNHSFNDFKCFGPSATKDGEFTNTKIADFGCFTQDGKDSNKYYFACVCQSTINSKWYNFYQWGRVGQSSYDFQFVECSSEADAQKTYEKQCHSKNDKRGEWFEHPSLGKILRAKTGKDCYLVRNMAKRISALPDACTICSVKPIAKIDTSKTIFDTETEKLLKDLKAGTVSYARSKFSSGMIPDPDSIEEARKILALAAKSKTNDLKELTNILYSKIPKATYIGEKIELSSENIKNWYDDLDAFESAYKSEDSVEEELNVKYLLKHIDKSNQLWYNIERMVKASTRNRHSYIPGTIKILNIWEVTNIPNEFLKQQEKIAKEYSGNAFPLIFQPERTDLESKSNTQLLIHGSRTVNIGGILSTGFRLPKDLSGVVIIGANLGPGAYHASDYKKSAGYCSIKNGYWSSGSGGISGRSAFIFLNDVILGNPHVVSYPKGFSKPPQGYHSVIADTNGSFQNEEFVVYCVEQFYPRYLIEFDL